MQPPQPAQNKLTEIAVLVIVAMLIVSGVFLLYVSKIDFTGMLTLFGFAGGVLGVQGAFKAPSPTQSAQLQALFSQIMNVLPGLIAQLQPPAVTIHNTIPESTPVTPPVAPSTPAQSAAQLGGSFGQTANAVPQVPFPQITFGAIPATQPPAQA